MADGCGCGTLAAAIADRYEAFIVVPGQPVTHLCELLARRHPVEWALNEKHAVEEAVGLSVSGVPTAVVMKHNGFSIALDPVANASRHGTGASILLVVGDDLAATASTTLQDSRALAATAGVPVLDPAGAASFAPLVAAAFDVSGAARLPVVLRVSGALHDLAAEPHEPCPVRAAPAAFDRGIAHDISKFGRYQHHRVTTWPTVTAALAGLSGTTCAEPSCGTGIVCVGTAADLVPAGAAACVCRLESSWPLPEVAVDFAGRHATSLVLEEPAAFVEDLLRGTGRVAGRRTGHLPVEGPLDRESVGRAVADPARPSYEPAWDAVEARRAAPPRARGFDYLFNALARVPEEDLFVAADVGSSVQLCYPPYARADVALCLGSAASVAAGAAAAGRVSAGVLGDHALLHSGLAGVYDVARRRLPVLLVVLANGTCAQTGGQPVAVSAQHQETLTPEEVVRLLKGLGVTTTTVLRSPDDSFDLLTSMVKDVANGCGPAALVATPDEG